MRTDNINRHTSGQSTTGTRLRGLQGHQVMIHLLLHVPPPGREREQRQSTARGRERSQTPVGRNTRTRTESRSNWTDRSLPAAGVPEPPPPPSRMSGSQWLNQGYREPPSSSTSYRYSGQSDQQPYHRNNPRTYNVEYVPIYQVPQNRWIRKHDGLANG